jgi:hypothetical protein
MKATLKENAEENSVHEENENHFAPERRRK